MNITNLLKQVKKGDPKAEKVFYDYCYQHCFKVALICCRDKQEATSIFNHSMLYVFEHLNQLTQEDGLIKWVNRIIRNDCIDHVRKQTVYKNKLTVVSEQKNLERSFNDAVSKIAMQEIIALVNELKPDFKLCFVLKVMEGFSYPEIAERLAINANTAKWYVAEAKKILRNKILQQEIIKNKGFGHGTKR